jgi:hypothetical protein
MSATVKSASTKHGGPAVKGSTPSTPTQHTGPVGMEAIKKAITTEFANQFPPKYERQYDIVSGSLSMGYPRNGMVNFKFTAHVTAGAFVGYRDLGNVEFTGLYDMRQKKTSFIEGQL